MGCTRTFRPGLAAVRRKVWPNHVLRYITVALLPSKPRQPGDCISLLLLVDMRVDVHRQSDVAMAGQGRRQDRDRLLYKPKDSKTYRVAYGDLSVKDAAPEDLPSQAVP